MQVFVLDIYRFLAKLRLTGAMSAQLCTVQRRDAMSGYERQILETERRYDQLMREIERQDPDVLYSVVPGSRLHEIIHNPVTEGIDEG
jgi:hypothetical protein